MQADSLMPHDNDELTLALPTNFPVVVLMQRQPSVVSQWSDYQWQAVGVMAIANNIYDSESPRTVHDDGDVIQVLYGGFTVQLFVDECESYYFNLISPNPQCYVIARADDENVPVPFLVSMSFDEAQAYLEGDEEVFVVDVPPELYRWTEAFVLKHYNPQKRKKRKRDDWKSHEEERHQ